MVEMKLTRSTQQAGTHQDSTGGKVELGEPIIGDADFETATVLNDALPDEMASEERTDFINSVFRA
jgi:hypothetical protein